MEPKYAYASADNGPAAVEIPAVQNQRQRITSIHAGFDQPAAALVEVRVGGNTVAAFPVHDHRDIDFPDGLLFPPATAVTVELGASGSDGVVGHLMVTYLTE